VTRSQAAVLLLKAEHTNSYLPPACAGLFADVPCPSPFADWIEQLAAEGVTAGCGGGFFCPDAPVTRAQIAVLLLKTRNGSSHVPPSCTGLFSDVYCPGPFTDWVEELATTGVSAGCGASLYCPDRPTSRGEQAVFVVKTFALTLPFPYTPTP
jgi:hypothetical protein